MNPKFLINFINRNEEKLRDEYTDRKAILREIEPKPSTKGEKFDRLKGKNKAAK